MNVYEINNEGVEDIPLSQEVPLGAINDDDNFEEQNITMSFFKIWKKISKLGFPMAASFTFSIEIFLMLMLFNNMSESEEDLASAALITTVLNTACIIGFSPIFALSVVASNKIGELKKAIEDHEDDEDLQKRKEYIAGINRNGMIIAGLTSLPVMTTLAFSESILTTLFRQNPLEAQMAQTVLRRYIPAVLGLNTRMAFEQMLFSHNKSLAAMTLGLGSLTIGTALAVWLGYGGGIDALGAEGVIIGFGVEAWLTSILYGLYLGNNKDFKDYEFFKIYKSFPGQWKQLKELAKISSFISFAVTSEVINSLSIAVFSGWVGTTPQAAVADINQFISLNFILSSAFGQASSQELNRLMGSKDYQNASRVAKYSLLTTLMYTTPLPLICAIYPNFLVLLNNGADKEQLLKILKYLAPIMAAGTIVDTARYNILQQLRVLKDLKGSTIISVAALGGGMIASGALSQTRAEIYGVGLGYTAGVTTAFFGLAYRWKNRIKPVKIQEIQEAEQNRVVVPKDSKSSSSCFGFFSKCIKNKLEEKPLLNNDREVAFTI